MPSVRVLIRLKDENITPAFYDVSPRVDYESLTWESNSEGTSANATIRIWTILPKSGVGLLDHDGATEADRVNAAIIDESFILNIPNRTDVKIIDASTSPSTVLFSGIITRVSTLREGGSVTQSIECADNTAILEEHIIADYYAPRDSRDVDIINGGDGAVTLSTFLPPVVGQVDSVKLSSEATGGSLTDGTYTVRIQPRSSTMRGRDGALVQVGPPTKELSITLNAATSTQKIKVMWKNAQLADSHRVYIKKTSQTVTEYLGAKANTMIAGVAISSISRTNNVVTVKTSSAINLVAGDPIVISVPQTSGFSVFVEDAVTIKTRSSSTQFTYTLIGADGDGSATGAMLSSGGVAYISSLSLGESAIDLSYTSARGWSDGEIYSVSGSSFRLGVGNTNIRGWQYPISVFQAMFSSEWIDEIGLDVSTYVEPVNTQYRFSPYFNESDTPNAEQYGGRTLRNLLDYISEKTGAEYWIDKGSYDAEGNYKCNLHYRAKTPKELTSNGLYDGNVDGWVLSEGFTLDPSTSGPFGAGYSVSSSTPLSTVTTATDKRIASAVGNKYFISVRGIASAHKDRWGAHIDWYDVSGGLVSSESIGVLPDESEWYRVWKIVSAPAGSASFGLRGICSNTESGEAAFTDWSAIEINAGFGYGDAEDYVTYPVPIYEMEKTNSPVESGGFANRLHLYAVFRTRDASGDKVALLDVNGNPVQYLDYDFVPGIWATSGKIIEAAITDERVETIADAELAAEGYWKENGLPIESYTFEMRPDMADGTPYPIPEVGQVLPFIWNLLGVAKPLIVKSVSGRTQGMYAVYEITVGGDIRLQRSAFIRLSERIKELAAINPIPDTPDAPSSLTPTTSQRGISLAWSFNDSSDVNKNLSSFEIQRQDGLFKEISSIEKSNYRATVTTSGSHGLVEGDTVRLEFDTTNAIIATLSGQYTVDSKTTTSFDVISVNDTNIASTSADGYVYYNFSEFRTVQNSKTTYVNDVGLYPSLQYRYKVRALSTEGTASAFSEVTDPVSPTEIVSEVADGSVTLGKLASELRPLEIITSASLPSLNNPDGNSTYPEGMIVYHLGGTPSGLKRVYRDSSNLSTPWSWAEAVGAGDIVAQSITAGQISAAGLDASIIKSGQLTIDGRWGATSGTAKVLHYQRLSGTATLTTEGVNEFAVGDTAEVSGINGTFDGASKTVTTASGASLVAMQVSRKQRIGNIATLTLAEKHAFRSGENINVTGVDAALNSQNATSRDFAVAYDYAPLQAKQKTSNQAVITTQYAHGFSNGDLVTVTGADSDFNVSNESITATNSAVIATQHDGVDATLTTQYAHGFSAGDTVHVSGLSSPYQGGGSHLINATGVPVDAAAKNGTYAVIRTSGKNGIAAGDGVRVSGAGSPYDGDFTAHSIDATVSQYQSVGQLYPVVKAQRSGTSVAARTSAVHALSAGDIITASISNTALNASGVTVSAVNSTVTGASNGVPVTARKNGVASSASGTIFTGALSALTMAGTAGTDYAAGGSVTGIKVGCPINKYAVSGTTMTLTTGSWASGTSTIQHNLLVGMSIWLTNIPVPAGSAAGSRDGIYTVSSIVSATVFTVTFSSTQPAVTTTTILGSKAYLRSQYAEVRTSGSHGFPTTTNSGSTNLVLNHFSSAPVSIQGVITTALNTTTYPGFTGDNYTSTGEASTTLSYLLPACANTATAVPVAIDSTTVRVKLTAASTITPTSGTMSATSVKTSTTSIASGSGLTATYPVPDFEPTQTTYAASFRTISGGSISNLYAKATTGTTANQLSATDFTSSGSSVSISGITGTGNSQVNIIPTQDTYSTARGVMIINSTTLFHFRLPPSSIFYSSWTLTSSRISNGVVELTSSSTIPFAVGDLVNVSGAGSSPSSGATYDGIRTVTYVSGSTFRYKVPISSSNKLNGEANVTGISNAWASDGKAKYTTSAAHTIEANDVVTVSGINSLYNVSNVSVLSRDTSSLWFIVQLPLTASVIGSLLTSQNGTASNGKQVFYSTSASGSVAYATVTGTVGSDEVTITTSDMHGFAAGDTVTVSNVTQASFNGTYTIGTVSSLISSASCSGGIATITTSSPHGFIPGDVVSVSGVGSAYDGNLTVSSIDPSSGGNPSQFTATVATTSAATVTGSGSVRSGKSFSYTAGSSGAAAIARTVQALNSPKPAASTGKTVSYLVTSEASGYRDEILIPSGASLSNGRLFSYTVASAALARATVSGPTADTYKTFRYTAPTSGFVNSTSISSGRASTGKTITYATGTSGTIAPQAVSGGSIANGRLVRYALNGTSAIAAAPAGATVSKRTSNYAISSPKFNVTYGGEVTATDLTLTGGGINLGSGDFVVTNGGAVTAKDLTLTGGGINLGTGVFTVSDAGAVAASDLSITGGGINLGSGVFTVSDAGAVVSSNLTTTGAFMSNLSVNPDGEPALIVSANSTEGDFAVPTGNRLDMGHWSGTAFAVGLRMTSDRDLHVDGTILYNQTFSDINYKKNIEPYQIDPSVIDRINIYTFDWDSDKAIREKKFGAKSDKKQFGVIAQEIEEHLPIAFMPAAEDVMASVDWQKITLAMIASIKDIRARLREAEERIAELEG
jgi:hypothetical protein